MKFTLEITCIETEINNHVDDRGDHVDDRGDHVDDSGDHNEMCLAASVLPSSDTQSDVYNVAIKKPAFQVCFNSFELPLKNTGKKLSTLMY